MSLQSIGLVRVRLVVCEAGQAVWPVRGEVDPVDLGLERDLADLTTDRPSLTLATTPGRW